MLPGYRHTNNSKIHSQNHPNINEQNNQKPNRFQNTGQTYKVTIGSLLYFVTVPF